MTPLDQDRVDPETAELLAQLSEIDGVARFQLWEGHIKIWVTNQSNQFCKVARRVHRVLEAHVGEEIKLDISHLPRGNEGGEKHKGGGRHSAKVANC